MLEAVERLPGGVSAEVYALRLRDPRAGQRRVVLRQHGVDTHPGRQADRTAAHHALLSALHRAGLPVPEPLLLDTTTEVLPAPYLVMAFVAGTSEIDAERVPASLDVMADVLLRIHALSGHELPELPPRLDPLPQALDYLPAACAGCRAAPPPAGPHGESAYRGQPGLLHGDFWPGNLLWQDDRLAAIIDWEDAALGDPLSDLAGSRLELTWKFGPGAAARFTRHDAARRQVDQWRLRLWDLYVAAAAWQFMGDWDLDPALETHMRDGAEWFIGQAGEALLGQPEA
ncbi:MAG: phosphotransferase [Gammaproteobacteria bacterium]|nr:phosphotransferase [Gammaproteobacteria bacterium]